MANIREALLAILEADATLTGLLAPGAIFFNRVPDNPDYPLLLVHEGSEEDDQLLEGSPTKLYDSEYQADVYGNDLDVVQQIAEHLAEALPGSTVAGSINLQNLFDFRIVKKAVWEDELEKWRAITEFTCRYRRGS